MRAAGGCASASRHACSGINRRKTMQHLFTPEGERALQAVMRREPLLAFDFDGTLAPIVAHPDDAAVPPTEARLLAQLSLRRPVAIVTGRRVADVPGRLGFQAQFIIGNHGAEDDTPGIPAAAGLALDTLRRRLAAEAPALAAAGVTV